MRYSETLVKDMHGQSAGPSYTQQKDKEGWGKEGWRGKRGQRGGETKTFGLICRTGQQKFLWYVFIACLRWRKHHGVIKKKKPSPCFFSSGPSTG